MKNHKSLLISSTGKIFALFLALIMGLTSCQKLDEAGFNVRPEPTGGGSRYCSMVKICHRRG
jgi:hypothetical protein